MKYNPFLLLKSPRIPSVPRGWFAFDATGPSVGMGFGMLLATVVPQFSLAQEQAPGSLQQARQIQKDELRLRVEVSVQKNSATLATAESSKASPHSAGVVTAMPRLSEKLLSPEELRELRRQLFLQP